MNTIINMKYLKDIRIIAASFLLLTSCATTSHRGLNQNNHVQQQVDLPGPHHQVPVENRAELGLGSDAVSDILDEERILNEGAEGVTHQSITEEIPLPTNKYVNKWIKYFTGPGRHGMRKFLERSGKYVNSMKQVLLNKGLPADLVYLPVIESGFATKALSHKGAMGYWQFMPSTARQYGLKVNSMVDERRDYLRSTEGAAVYLKKLYTVFGDWYLALAAYNAGENRVKSQLMKAETRNYWELIDKKGLYKETRDYVPKYIAATLIAKNPRQYGFKQINYQGEQNYQKLYVKKSIDLKKLAKNMGVSFAELKKLNPMYKTAKVPVYRRPSVLVRVPRGALTKAQASLVKSRTYIPKNVYKPLKTATYKVRKGDNLTKIARRFGVTVNQLKRRNGLGRRSVLYVGRRLKIDSSSAANRVSKVDRRPSRARDRARQKVHKVKSGDSLTRVAKKYGMTLGEIARLNGFSVKKKLKVGEKIKLVAQATNKGRAHSSQVQSHKVKYGENLNLLARKYKTTVAAIKRQNKLRSTKLRVGQKLKIKTGQVKYHVVRRGENLAVIAKKYKVSLGKLLSVNNFKNKSKILIGSRVKIPLLSMN